MFLSAVSHFSHPVTEIPLPLFRVHEDELRALHEIGTKTLGPTFGDVVERVVAASAILLWYPENRGIYTQSDSSKKSSRNIWSLAVVSVDQRY